VDHLSAASHNADANTDIEVLREVPKHFCVVDEQSAAWVIRRIMEARTYGAKVRAWSEQEQRRAEREEKTLMFLFGRQLENWAKDEIAKLNGRRKSIALPPGTIGFRSVTAALHVDDEAQVMHWCRSHLPPAIVIAEKLSRTVLKEHFERTGELPDGTRVEPGGEKFYLR
jgi:hypothetical protein